MTFITITYQTCGEVIESQTSSYRWTSSLFMMFSSIRPILFRWYLVDPKPIIEKPQVFFATSDTIRYSTWYVSLFGETRNMRPTLVIRNMRSFLNINICCGSMVLVPLTLRRTWRLLWCTLLQEGLWRLAPHASSPSCAWVLPQQCGFVVCPWRWPWLLWPRVLVLPAGLSRCPPPTRPFRSRPSCQPPAYPVRLQDRRASRRSGVRLQARRRWIACRQSCRASCLREVLTDLQNRGVEDIMICCVDGLKGFPDAIQSVFPHTAVQLCIVHQIRNSIKIHKGDPSSHLHNKYRWGLSPSDS